MFHFIFDGELLLFTSAQAGEIPGPVSLMNAIGFDLDLAFQNVKDIINSGFFNNCHRGMDFMNPACHGGRAGRVEHFGNA